MPVARAVAEAKTVGAATAEKADPARAYAELREMITAAGLLERAYAYYVWRSGLSLMRTWVTVAGLT